MATQVTVPEMGESVVEATVGKWLVKEGDEVEKDQPLVELETDKADSEVNSTADGVVTKIAASEGDTVSPGDLLCEVGEAEESAGEGAGAREEKKTGTDENKKAKGKGEPEKKGGGKAKKEAGEGKEEEEEGSEGEGDEGDRGAPRTSPSVRKLARERGVDLDSVEGSGKGGRITRQDVLDAAGEGDGGEDGEDEKRAEAKEKPPRRKSPEEVSAQMEAKAALRPPPTPSDQPPERMAPETGPLGAFKVPPYRQEEGDEIIPFTRRRRIIADHMMYSKRTAPDVVTFAECDLHQTSKVRDQHKGEAKKSGVNLTFLAFAAAATCRALREFPDLNARVLEDAHVRLRHINLGIAVDTEQGLVVPVVPDADELTVRGLARAIDEVATRARDGKLSPDDLANKTFTISNPGRRGNLVGGAIISQPNVGILRLGTIKKRVVVVEREDDDYMAIHPVMQMALTYDHRIVDGVRANGFLFRVSEILEEGDFEL